MTTSKHNEHQVASSSQKKTMKTGQWSQEEHNSFLRGLMKYNSASQKWKLIAKEFVTTRTRTQTASHSQKYWKRLRIGLKRLSGPKKHKHCVQCTECDGWYTGRYWTEDECWALKEWWICDACEEGNPNKKKFTEVVDSSTDSSDSDETSDSESSQRSTRSGSFSPTTSNDNESQVPNPARVRCVCLHDERKSEDEMIECRSCHNLLHKDCLKENLESDGTLSSCPNCSVSSYNDILGKKRELSEEGDDLMKSALPLKKRRFGY